MSERLAKNIIFVFIIIIGGKILSFFRDILVTYYFGANANTDSYFIANSVPSILYTAILSSILVLFIPLYKEAQVTKGNIEADKYASRVINVLIIISLLLTGFGLLFQNQIISLLAPGYSETQKALTSHMCNILLLSFPLSSISLLLANISNANKKYYSVQIIPIISSVVVVIALFIFHQYGIFSLIYSTVFAFAIQLIVQIGIVKSHFKYTFKSNVFHPDIKAIFLLILPVFIGYTMDQINLVINSSFCTYLDVGNVSFYNYALRFQTTFISTISLAVVTILYPILSELFFKYENKQFNFLLNTGIQVISYTTVPISIFLSMNAESLIQIVYGRGQFSEYAVHATSAIFSILILSLIALSIRDLIIRIYFIHKNTKIPLISSLIFGLVNAGLGYYLMTILGAKGLAIAYFASSTIAVLYLMIMLNHINHSKVSDKILNFDKQFLFNNCILALLPIVIYYLFKQIHFHGGALLTVLIQFILLIIFVAVYLYYRRDTYMLQFVKLIRSKFNSYVQR